MKVLHLIPSMSPRRGGPSAAIAPMTRALGGLGVECAVVTTDDDGPDTLDVPLGRWVERDGVKTWFLPRFSPSVRAVREFAWTPGFPRRMREMLRQCDIVHVHALFSYVSSGAMALARRTGMPYVLRPLGLLEEWSLAQSPLRKRAFLALCDRANVRGAAAVHFTSMREMEVSRHVPEGKGFVAALGVECPERTPGLRARVRAELGVSGEQCVFLFLSRWHPKKRIENLLRALAAMRERSWTLVLAGAGDASYEKAVYREIERLGLSGRVRTPGFVEAEGKTGLLEAADVFVLPSHSENFGIAVAEAMAAGLPPVVSEGVALAPDIARADAGWVVRGGEDALAGVLTVALESPSERASRGARAAAIAREEYSWERSARQIAAQYERILAGGMR